MTYDKYVMRIADTLVDDYNLHPDDAVELIDMNKVKVAKWYGTPPNLVAYQLMLSLRSMIANPISSSNVLALGALAAVVVGAVLVTKSISSHTENAPNDYEPPPTLYV